MIQPFAMRPELHFGDCNVAEFVLLAKKLGRSVIDLRLDLACRGEPGFEVRHTQVLIALDRVTSVSWRRSGTP